MMSLTLEEIRMAVGGEWVFQPTGHISRGISTDTRTLGTGELFVALSGDSHDGHDFLEEAEKQGAPGAIIEYVPDDITRSSEFGLIQVDSTLQALGDIAEYYRNILSTERIAITGSHGKSTTKEMTAHILSQSHAVTSAPRSYNNRIGVPLTMFRVDPTDDFAVFELGTNQHGEIDLLADMVRPHIAVLTNVSNTHLEGLNSVEGVREEKSAIFRHFEGAERAIYNADNRHVQEIVDRFGIDGISFSMYRESDLKASAVDSTLQGVSFSINNDVRVELPVVGSWNVYNALAAIATSLEAGIDLKTAAHSLETYAPLPGRMRVQQLQGVTLINDAYNANPRSMQLVLEEFDHYAWSGRKVIVLGDMAELGDQETELHRELGRRIGTLHEVDLALLVGDAMQHAADELRELNDGPDFETFASTENLENEITRQVGDGDLVLLKASRASHLDRVAEELETEFGGKVSSPSNPS